MILTQKSLEKLRCLINEETEYRSGPQLVKFFNVLGFNDSYGQGFPSRWIFTDEKLNPLNATPELDKCIKTVLIFVTGSIRTAILSTSGYSMISFVSTIDY